MSDFKFETEEILAAVQELVPSYQREAIKSVILSENSTDSDYERAGLSLLGETKGKAGFIIPTSAPSSSTQGIWKAIKAEVYNYLCTNSKRYSKERNEAGVTLKNIISIIATAIASTYNIAVGIVTGAVTIALLSALKIGKNAWCEVNKPE